MEKICGIYRIENLVNHKIYIGLSKDCMKRWHDHRSKAFNSTREDDIKKPLYMAMRKYGLDNFTFEIIEKCDELGLKPSGSIFKRTPKEIEDIYNIYKDLLDRNPDQNAYNKKPQEVLKILKLCIKNNIKITGTLYRKTSEELESTINYIKQYYSDEYLTPQIIIYDKNHIEKIFNYLSGKKILHTIIKSSGILRLTLEELIDREIYIRMINQDLVVGETFNPVMGWSKKEYEKRKKELNKNK